MTILSCQSLQSTQALQDFADDLITCGIYKTTLLSTESPVVVEWIAGDKSRFHSLSQADVTMVLFVTALPMMR